MTNTDSRIADAPPANWVDKYAPAFTRPYMKLARLDRPIGTWLLLWPCLWSIALAADGWPDLWLMALFGIGAVVMRGAGCTYNDIVDRDIDGRVARTALRPIPSGAVSLTQAFMFLGFQLLIGLAILLSLSATAIELGFASVLLIAVYPWMKRITYWPQIVLGLVFNWGALMGYAAVQRPGLFEMVMPPFGDPKYFGWVAPGGEDSATLIAAINDALLKMHEDGRLTAINEKWLGTAPELPTTMPDVK